MKAKINMIVNEKLDQNSILPVAYTGQNKGAYGLSGYCNPLRIDKTWGYELIFQNHNFYCCKILFIEKGKSCSFHFHMEKHETLLVTNGTLHIDSIHNKEKHTHVVHAANAFVIAPGFIHSLRAKDEAVTLIETSTPSYDTDSIRILNGE